MPIMQAIAAILLILLVFLIVMAYRALRNYRTDPKAPRRFRALALSSAITALALLGTYASHDLINNAIIEPVGGISTESSRNSRSWTPQYIPPQEPELQRIQPSAPTPDIPETGTGNNSTLPVPADTITWSGHGPLASALRADRLIVHSADTSIVVKDIPNALAHIEHTAKNLGGWLVSSHHDSRHSGAASIRVPAQTLRQALDTIHSAAFKVASLHLSSEDVTEEFIDTRSRLNALDVTETSYTKLLAEAPNLIVSLQIREPLLEIQQDIEKMRGRLKYLSEVAAFSLINITVTVAPAPLEIDAGEDITVQAGKSTGFDAIITPQEPSTDIYYTWDFGDGTPEESGNRTAPVFGSPGKRITNPTHHTYPHEGKHIVQVLAQSTSDAGIAEGTGTLTVTVKAIPFIHLSVPANSLTVEEGDELSVVAKFRRPQGLSAYEYVWDFGDGSPTTLAQIPQGITQIKSTHVYDHVYSYSPATATVTINALSEAGNVSATTEYRVFVTESTSLMAGNWDIAGWAKDGVRAVFATLSVLTMLTTWLLIFSPFIALLAGALFFAYRRRWIGPKDE